MLKKIVLTFISFVILTGCLQQQSSTLTTNSISLDTKGQPPSSFIPKTIKVVAIGDSLTEGIGDESNQGGYIGMLKEELEEENGIKEVELTNFGVKGHKTSNLQKKLKEQKVISSLKEADFVIMTIGGNDLMKVVRANLFSLDYEPFRLEQKNFEKNLKDIFTTIRKHNAKAEIVYIGLYNPFKHMLPELTEIDEIIFEWNMSTQQMLQKDKHSIYVSVEDIFISESEEMLLSEDQFHPNSKGYSLIADRVLEKMKSESLFVDIR